MSWSVGRNIFMELWPVLKESIDDEEQLECFVHELSFAFGEFDVDFQELEGFDSELDRIIENLSERDSARNERIEELERKAAAYDELMKKKKTTSKKKRARK